MSVGESRAIFCRAFCVVPASCCFVVRFAGFVQRYCSRSFRAAFPQPGRSKTGDRRGEYPEADKGRVQRVGDSARGFRAGRLAEANAHSKTAYSALICLRSEEHTPELQSHLNLLYPLLLVKKKP